MAEPMVQFPEVGEKPKLKWNKTMVVIWSLVVIVLIFVVVQYLNASRYEALVQVIDDDRIGVNPTGAKLDFGDLPRNKDAVRKVTLQSSGSIGSYVMIWKYGDIADFIKISENNFVLKPGEKKDLEFSVHIPDSADFKYYKGKVVIFRIPKVW